MKWLVGLIILILPVLSACRSLPSLIPLGPAEKREARCNTPFVSAKQQFIHSIAAMLPGQNQSLVTGITIVSPEQRSVHALIMTIEGLVLFEGAVDHDRIQIRRSVPPFSSPSFSTGLMNDVRLIFLSPADIPVLIGKSGLNEIVCRYLRRDGAYVDVVIEPEAGWRLLQYDADFRLERRVRAWGRKGRQSDGDGGAPARIELQAEGVAGYRLDMELLRQTAY